MRSLGCVAFTATAGDTLPYARDIQARQASEDARAITPPGRAPSAAGPLAGERRRSADHLRATRQLVPRRPFENTGRVGSAGLFRPCFVGRLAQATSIGRTVRPASPPLDARLISWRAAGWPVRLAPAAGSPPHTPPPPICPSCKFPTVPGPSGPGPRAPQHDDSGIAIIQRGPLPPTCWLTRARRRLARGAVAHHMIPARPRYDKSLGRRAIHFTSRMRPGRDNSLTPIAVQGGVWPCMKRSRTCL